MTSFVAAEVEDQTSGEEALAETAVDQSRSNSVSSLIALAKNKNNAQGTTLAESLIESEKDFKTHQKEREAKLEEMRKSIKAEVESEGGAEWNPFKAAGGVFQKVKKSSKDLFDKAKKALKLAEDVENLAETEAEKDYKTHSIEREAKLEKMRNSMKAEVEDVETLAETESEQTNSISNMIALAKKRNSQDSTLAETEVETEDDFKAHQKEREAKLAVLRSRIEIEATEEAKTLAEVDIESTLQKSNDDYNKHLQEKAKKEAAIRDSLKTLAESEVELEDYTDVHAQ